MTDIIVIGGGIAGISAAANVSAAVAHPHALPDGAGVVATNPQYHARPAVRPVWSHAARIPACGLRGGGTAGAPCSGEEPVGKGVALGAV